MTDREAMKLALENICGAILCEINPMSSRKEMLRLMDEAIAALHQALEQPSDIEAAVKKENEACAEIAYSMAYSEDEAEEIAKAIRERMK